MPSYYSAATLAVAAVYCVWRAWAQAQTQRHRLLCRRVAYMLWVAAGAGDDAGAACGSRADFGYDEE
jgi:hypothetical protein